MQKCRYTGEHWRIDDRPEWQEYLLALRDVFEGYMAGGVGAEQDFRHQN